MLLKPRFGIRMWSGIWPPSKPKTETPERLFWPFWPRPAVLPRPEPMPRPTRTRDLRAPLLSRISLSFMSCTRCSLPRRKPGPSLSLWPHRTSRLARWIPAFAGMKAEGLALDRHHVMDAADHAADFGGVVE